LIGAAILGDGAMQIAPVRHQIPIRPDSPNRLRVMAGT
jgi:hypothetical protein